MGYCAVSRKYGVSDNAVRKWIRWYDFERQAETHAQRQASEDDPPDTIAA
jgi:transposase-like protein